MELKPLRRSVRPSGLVCTYPECGNPEYARDLCRKHHDQLIRGVELHGLSPDEVTRFKRKKQREAWARMSADEKAARKSGLIAGHYERTDEWRRKMSAAKVGRTYQFKSGPRRCVGCEAEFEQLSGPQVWCSIPCREKHRKAKRYGMTMPEFDALIGPGVCALCGCSGKLNVDHDHSTGKVRGMLCNRCNTGLGKLGDSPATLRKALRYLGG